MRTLLRLLTLTATVMTGPSCGGGDGDEGEAESGEDDAIEVVPIPLYAAGGGLVAWELLR